MIKNVHNNGGTHIGDKTEPRMLELSKCFGFWENFKKSCSCCGGGIWTNNKMMKVENNPSMEFKEAFDNNLAECALRLNVKETGSLKLDPFLLHPFVKIHVVDMVTHKYLAKRNP